MTIDQKRRRENGGENNAKKSVGNAKYVVGIEIEYFAQVSESVESGHFVPFDVVGYCLLAYAEFFGDGGL